MSVVTFQHPSNVFDWNAVTNDLENTGQAAQRFFVAKPQHLQPSSLEFPSALSVIRSSLWRVVDAAVKFNHQASFSAVKINNVPIKGFLTQEAQPLEFSTAQRLPQNRFGRRWIFAVLPLQLERVKRFFDGLRLIDCSGWRSGHSHPAAARRPSLADERSAQARQVLLSGQDRVGDESGVPNSAPSQSERA